jgi:hypothetical protein
MFAMLFTLYVAVLAATLWALRSFLLDSGTPHDPSTLELAAMAGITLATYGWMRRLRAILERTPVAATTVSEDAPPTPVPARYAEAVAEAEREELLESEEHAA